MLCGEGGDNLPAEPEVVDVDVVGGGGGGTELGGGLYAIMGSNLDDADADEDDVGLPTPPAAGGGGGGAYEGGPGGGGGTE